MTEPKNILVPHDFSDASNQALSNAESLAKSFGATVHVLHIVVDPYTEVWSIDATGMDLGSLVSRWQLDAQKRLDDLSVGVPHERVTKVGQPHKEIVAYAKEHDIDMIVMGTHGRGFVEHMLLGSVAEKVLRTAPCPVMTVRAPKA